MVKSEDGTFYLWENQHDLLYELGNSRDQVKSTLALDNWDNVKASDPRGHRQQRQLCRDELLWQHIWYIPFTLITPSITYLSIDYATIHFQEQKGSLTSGNPSTHLVLLVTKSKYPPPCHHYSIVIYYFKHDFCSMRFK